MSKAHRLISTFAVLGFLTIGCNQHQPAASQRIGSSVAATQPAAALPRSAAAEPIVVAESPSTADAVAQKARAYASQMEKVLNDSSARAAAARQPATRPTEGSAVQWIDPKTIRQGGYPQEKEVAVSSATAPRDSSAVASNTSLTVNAASGAPHDAPAARQDGPPPVQAASAVSAAPKFVDPPKNPAPPSWPAGDELSRRLLQHVRDYPQDLAGQLEYEAFQFARGENVPDMTTLAGLAPEDREVLSAVLDGLSNFRIGLRTDNNMLLSRKIKPLLDVADRLRTQAELSVPIVALCTKVENYGKYEPFDPLHFVGGVEHEVIVYCEVENFSSQLDSQKLWETSLRQEIVVYSDQGMQVWTPDKVAPRPSIDRSRTRHHDFFLGRKIHLPANLSIGRYILKVSVVDQQINRVAENTVAFEIVAQ